MSLLITILLWVSAIVMSIVTVKLTIASVVMYQQLTRFVMFLWAITLFLWALILIRSLLNMIMENTQAQIVIVVLIALLIILGPSKNKKSKEVKK